MRLLLVEDDETVAESLLRALPGRQVERVTTGAAALAHPGPYDLVLLDLDLPDGDGLTLLRELVRRGEAPVIVLCARGDHAVQQLAHQLGADDYVWKPIELSEVLARIRAVVRLPRSLRQPGDGPERHGTRLTIDRATARVLVDGEEVALSLKEYDFLACLAEAPGTVKTRRGLLKEVWRTDWYGPATELDVCAARLRHKLAGAVMIEPVRDVGFRLVVPEGDGLRESAD
ncbi:response regulator transcription factor [Streptomyces sp. NPDC052043]|uniref:response regulator transcription factor n=1 Tax=Streptomyces sp. NPDC052043 TaxID=3365684 RepID=UPI0037D0F60D